MKKTLNFEKRLTGYQLKMIALALMVVDHIHYYFSDIYNLPMVLTWAGRIVAPIFIFLVVEGYFHTRDVKKYLTRLYLGFVAMSIFNNLIVNVFPRPDEILVAHSMFGSLFLIVVHLLIIDRVYKSIEEKNNIGTVKNIILLTIPSILSFLFLLAFEALPSVVSTFVMIFIPTVFLVEGNLIFIILAIALYSFRSNRNLQMIVFAMFSLTLLPPGGLSFHALFYEHYQWMMIMALPLLFLYNEEKGKDNKYFFYVFYPVHIYILYFISVMIY